jgi:hypothetical protein
VAPLLASVVWLCGCTGHIKDSDVVTHVDEQTVTAIDIARTVPKVARYLRSHPAGPDFPLWTVHDDYFYLRDDDNDLRIDRYDSYGLRRYRCNDEYIVEVYAPSLRTASPLPSPHPSALFSVGELDVIVLVNIRTRASRTISWDDEYATRDQAASAAPSPAATPCLDGSQPATTAQ